MLGFEVLRPITAGIYANDVAEYIHHVAEVKLGFDRCAAEPPRRAVVKV
jgi:hypothetical protein